MDPINDGKVVFWGDTHKTCGIHLSPTNGGGHLSTKRSFTRERWTQLTLLVNIMTYTTFTQSNWSVSSAVVNPLFSRMSERAGESVAASASAKRKPVHCTAMIARKLNNKSADMDWHAVPPPDYKAGGDSKR